MTEQPNFYSRATQRPVTPDEFKANAELAESDLMQKIEADPSLKAAVIAVAKFWKKWYPITGHKHLGRILVKFADR